MVASRIPSTKENPKGPLATPVLDREEILRKARDLLRHTSSVAKNATSSISKNLSAETLNSQKYLDTSEKYRAWALFWL